MVSNGTVTHITFQIARGAREAQDLQVQTAPCQEVILVLGEDVVVHPVAMMSTMLIANKPLPGSTEGLQIIRGSHQVLGVHLHRTVEDLQTSECHDLIGFVHLLLTMDDHLRIIQIVCSHLARGGLHQLQARMLLVVGCNKLTTSRQDLGTKGQPFH